MHCLLLRLLWVLKYLLWRNSTRRKKELGFRARINSPYFLSGEKIRVTTTSPGRFHHKISLWVVKDKAQIWFYAKGEESKFNLCALPHSAKFFFPTWILSGPALAALGFGKATGNFVNLPCIQRGNSFVLQGWLFCALARRGAECPAFFFILSRPSRICPFRSYDFCPFICCFLRR